MSGILKKRGYIIWLVFNPSEKIVNWDDCSQYMGNKKKTCSKPATSYSKLISDLEDLGRFWVPSGNLTVCY